jgi:hypothetical protein
LTFPSGQAACSWEPGRLPGPGGELMDLMTRLPLAWTRQQRREPAGAPRQVLIADQRTATPDTLVCDLTIPLR